MGATLKSYMNDIKNIEATNGKLQFASQSLQCIVGLVSLQKFLDPSADYNTCKYIMFDIIRQHIYNKNLHFTSPNAPKITDYKEIINTQLEEADDNAVIDIITQTCPELGTLIQSNSALINGPLKDTSSGVPRLNSTEYKNIKLGSKLYPLLDTVLTRLISAFLQIPDKNGTIARQIPKVQSASVTPSSIAINTPGTSTNPPGNDTNTPGDDSTNTPGTSNNTPGDDSTNPPGTNSSPASDSRKQPNPASIAINSHGSIPDPTDGLPASTIAALKGMTISDSQLQEAIDYVNNTPGNQFAPFILTYHPGLTERAIANLLDLHTVDGTHRNYTPKQTVNKVMIPPAFRMDQSPAIWTRAVIDSLGYPFINFTCPSVLELLRGTDPVRIREAYKRVKKMFKQFGLKKPIATLQEFAHSSYRNCILNALVVDAQELYSAVPEAKVAVQVVNPYSKNLSTGKSLMVPVAFLTTFYGVLSPVAAAAQYASLSGKTVEEYRNELAATGMPQVYILNPKKNQFRRGPKGSLLHRIFSDKAAPVLVRTRVSTHDGGFLIPERDADKLLTE